MRCWWGCLLLAGCFGDHDPPEIVSLTPGDGADRTGVESVSVDVTYRDASHVTARVFVGAEFIGTADRSCRDGECSGHLDWNTIPFPPGYHDLTVALEDAAGNVTTVKNEILLDDVLGITGMEVENIVDESGTLEIEVYAFDETGALLGCAGSRHGLATVDNSQIKYTTNATLITVDSRPFGTLAAAGGRFSLEVWEDDDEPVCPSPLVKAGNDFVGASPQLTVEQWRAMPQLSFTNVPVFSTGWGRPLSEGEIVDPALPDPDPWYDENGDGCNACGAATSGIAFALIAPLGLRRRRRRSRLAG